MSLTFFFFLCVLLISQKKAWAATSAPLRLHKLKSSCQLHPTCTEETEVNLFIYKSEGWTETGRHRGKQDDMRERWRGLLSAATHTAPDFPLLKASLVKQLFITLGSPELTIWAYGLRLSTNRCP